jgi:hypothetical protein
MKRSDSKKKICRKSPSKNEVAIGVEKGHSSSKSPSVSKPRDFHAPRSKGLRAKSGSANLQHLSIMFSSPESIRAYIYECASQVCENHIRARTTNETLLYKKLAQELPLFITLSGASDLVNHLCASKDPVKAFVLFKANLQIEKLRRATAKIATKGKRQNKALSRAPRKNEHALLTGSSAVKTSKTSH